MKKSVQRELAKGGYPARRGRVRESVSPDTSSGPSRGESGSEEVLPTLADLVVAMSRLLAELSTIEAFKETGFSLTDWIALSVLARGSVNNNNRLAKVLGVSRQRANQIKTSLEEIQLISSAQSSEDARENVLVVTDAGRTRLAEIDAKILAIMSTLKDEELVGRANRSVRLLRRAIRATTVQAVKSAGPGELDDERRD